MASALTTVDYTLITNPADALHLLENMGQYREVAMDLEGHNLGKTGTLSLITLMGTDNKIYIIDTQEPGLNLDNGDSVPFQDKLKQLLESENITKVIHGPQSDSAQLGKSNIILHAGQVFDPQSLQRALESYETKKPTKNLPLVGLVSLCEKYGIVLDDSEKELKVLIKDMMSGPKVAGKKRKADTSFTLKRPLTREFARYAASDVKYLLFLRRNMIETIHKKVDAKSIYYIANTWHELKEESLYKWIDDPEMLRKLKLQKNRRDRLELISYIEQNPLCALSKKDGSLLKTGRKGKQSHSPLRRSPRRGQAMDVEDDKCQEEIQQ